MKSLRDFTNARVQLGRVGDSLPTSRLLDFRLAQARARDAVHLPMDSRSLMQEFAKHGWDSLVLASAASNRHEYLLRPDLGRTLSPAARNYLTEAALEIPLLFCVADGLSAAAIHHHASKLLAELRSAEVRPAEVRPAEVRPEGPIVLIEQARVAVADCVGELVKAEVCVLLIGERPGLSSPDSLGVYITYKPRTGRSDAERNCISNIHDQGLSYVVAAQRIGYLINEARKLKLTGVELKDRAGSLE